MHHRLPTLLLVLTSLLALGACSGDAKDTHPDQLVTKRKAIFKQFTKTLEPMGMVNNLRITAKIADQISNGEAVARVRSANRDAEVPGTVPLLDGNAGTVAQHVGHGERGPVGE